MAADKAALYDKAQKQILKGQWQKAIELMERVHEADGSDPAVTLRLGDLLKKVGKGKEAAGYYFKTANIFAEQSEITKAAATYKMVLRIDPSMGEAQQRLNQLARRSETPPETGAEPPRIERPPVPLTERGPAGARPMEVYYVEPEARKSAPYGGVAAHETLPGLVPLGATVDRVASEYGPEEEEDIEPSSGDKRLVIEKFTKDSGLAEKREVKFLLDLEEDEFWELLGRMDRMTYGPGETIIREGDTGDSIYIISSGKVSITTTKGGVSIKLAELGEQDFFGEVAFLTGKPRTATVTAVVTTTVMELSRSQMDELINKHPNIARVLQMFHQDRVASTISTMRAISKGFI